MTATKHVTLWCDEEGCHRFVEVGEESSYGPARARARREGWRSGPAPRARSAAQDFCPDHAQGSGR